MSNTSYTYDISFNTASAISNLNSASQCATGATNVFDKLKTKILSIGTCAFAFNNIAQGIESLRNQLDSVIAPGVQLESSLAELSAITGVVGEGLDGIQNEARKTSLEFGGSASDAVESYKLLLSQLNPEISKVPEALSAMGKNVAVLSKTMGGDTKAASEVLTTAMNQFQVSTVDPIAASKEMAKMMNIMAAAAKEGSAELPAQKAALEQSGMAAKAAGVSFEETSAAIQVLDKAGKKGSEGGVALRNVLSTLSQGRFLPKDVQEELSAAGIKISDLTDKNKNLGERLAPLQHIMHDSALLTKLFGKENSNAALAIISGIGAMSDYQAKITGTNTAFDQAGVIMDSYSGKMARQKAFVDDLKIRFFNMTKGLMPYVQGFTSFMQGSASILMGINAVYCISEHLLTAAIKKRASSTWKATKAMFGNTKAFLFSLTPIKLYTIFTTFASAATLVFSKAIKTLWKAMSSSNPIGWIIAGVSLLVGGFTLAWNKSEKFRQIIFSIWEVVKAVFYNIGVVIKNVFENIIKPYAMFWINLYKAIGLVIWDALKWCFDKIVTGLNYVGDFFTWVWDGVKEGVQAVGDFMVGIWDWVSSGASSVGDFIVGAFHAIAEPIKSIFSGIWDFIKVIFDKMTQALKVPLEWIKSIWNKIFPKDQFKDVGSAIQTGMEKGSQSWANSKKGKEAGFIANIAQDAAGVSPAVDLTNSPKQPNQPAQKYKNKEVVDLNNIKGSTAYSAISSKISPKAIEGLRPNWTISGGGMSAVGSTTKKIAGNTITEKTNVINSRTQEYGHGKDFIGEIAKNVAKIAACISVVAGVSGLPNSTTISSSSDFKQTKEISPVITKKEKNIRFEKFTDQVVINVPQGTTKENAQAIMGELMRQINNMQS